MRAAPGSKEYRGHRYIHRILREIKPGNVIAVNGEWRTVVASGPNTYYKDVKANWRIDLEPMPDRKSSFNRYSLNPVMLSQGKVRTDGTPEDNVIV